MEPDLGMLKNCFGFKMMGVTRISGVGLNPTDVLTPSIAPLLQALHTIYNNTTIISLQCIITNLVQ